MIGWNDKKKGYKDKRTKPHPGVHSYSIKKEVCLTHLLFDKVRMKPGMRYRLLFGGVKLSLIDTRMHYRLNFVGHSLRVAGKEAVIRRKAQELISNKRLLSKFLLGVYVCRAGRIDESGSSYQGCQAK